MSEVSEGSDGCRCSTACFYCDKPGPIVCSDPECQQHDRELSESLDQAYHEELRLAVKAAIRQRCEPEENRQLNRLSRWFYTAKCLACVFLGWSRGRVKTTDYPDVIEVGRHHYANLYAGWEARWFVVGHGVFSQWWYELTEDGEWNM